MSFGVWGLWSLGCRTLFPFAFRVWPLVDKVSPGACAGLLVGDTGVCPLVGGTGPFPLMGRAVSRGVFRGNWVQKDFGSLSADGYTIFLPWWLFWLEAS